MGKVFSKIFNFIWKIFGGVAVIFAGVAVIANFLFTPKLFQKFTKLCPQLFSKKLFITSLSILVLIAGGFFAWRYFWAPKDETAGWQTYRNEEYGFEVGHPVRFTLEDDSRSQIFTLVFKDTAYGNFPIRVYVGDQEDELMQQAINPTEAENIAVVHKDRIVNGVNWKVVDEKVYPVDGVGMPGTSLGLYVKKENKIYMMQCYNCDAYIFGDPAKETKDIFDQILSTFKFLE